MLNFLKRNKLIIFLSLVVTTLVAAVTLSSVAWFVAPKSNFTPEEVSSEIITGYFDPDSGNGRSASHPLIITKPLHYYNLVGLYQNNQYKPDGEHLITDSGYYFQFGKKNVDNYDDGGDGDDDIYQFYAYDNNGAAMYSDSKFYNGDENDPVPLTSSYLNLNFYSGDRALIPLGSAAHPFVGHIIGNNLTLKNMHITGKGYDDIGVFGYVGTSTASAIKEIYFDNVEIDTNTPTHASTDGQSHNDHSSTAANIGHIAGHVANTAAFTDVYINDCRIYNSVEHSFSMINSYGYFGKCDEPNDTMGTSNSYSTKINPTNIYNTINDNYTQANSKNAVTRSPAGYELSNSEKYQTILSKSSDTYTMNNDANHNYSLSTLGYERTDSISKHVRYFTDSTHVARIDVDTTILNSAPTENELKAMEDGYYAYHDGTKWMYAHVTSDEPSQQEGVTFNAYTISIEISSTTYYWVVTESSGTYKLSLTSTAPGSADNDEPYYFVFKETVGSTGDSSISEVRNVNRMIYSPFCDSYMICGQGDTATQPYFGASSSADTFLITGPHDAEITYTNSSSEGCCVYVESGSIKSRTKKGGVTPSEFMIGTPAPTSTSTEHYSRINTLAALDPSNGTNAKVVLTSYFDSVISDSGTVTGLYAMDTNNVRNRHAKLITTDDANGLVTNEYYNATTDSITNTGAFMTFEVEKIGSNYAFMDNTYQKYLNVHTSGSNNNTSANSLFVDGEKENGTLPNTAQWNITIDTDTTSKLKDYNNGQYRIRSAYDTNEQYRMIMRGNKSNTGNWFSCYAKSAIYDTSSTHSSFPIWMYKLTSTETGSVWESTATEKTFYGSISTEKSVEYKTLHTASLSVLNPDSYQNYDSSVYFTENSNVIFNKNDSIVTFEAGASYEWQLVTSTSGITAGDTIILADRGSNNTAGTLSSSLLTAISSTFSTDPNKEKITTVGSGTIEFTVEAGYSNGSFAFKKGDNSNYLYYSGSSNNISENASKSSNNASWTLNSISNGLAQISNVSTSGDNTRYIKYNYSAPRFCGYLTGAGNTRFISIYKKVEISGSNAGFYVSDYISKYNPGNMDIVGNASYTSSAVTLATTPSIASAPTVNSDFAVTTYNNSIVLYVNKTDTRDLGTIVYEYTTASEGTPQFMLGGSTIALNSKGRTIVGASTTKVVIGLNTSNIASMALCAITDQGKVTTTEANIDRYVVVIGNTNTISITNVSLTYDHINGNNGNFQAVGYMKANYDEDGSFIVAGSRLTNTIIDVYYNVANTSGNQKVYFEMDYYIDNGEKYYSITFTSTVAMTINVFNYDSSNYHLIVNTTEYYGSTNIVNIAATA